MIEETRLAIGVRVTPQPDRRPPDEHVVSDPVDQLAVGDDVAAAGVE